MSSIFLCATAEDDISIERTGQLSWWYLINSIIGSIYWFAVSLIFPYFICCWISRNVACILLFSCVTIDESFRLFWYSFEVWLHHHKISKAIYLLHWETLDDLNTYFVVPFIVFLIVRRKLLFKHVTNNASNYFSEIHHSHFNLIAIFYFIASIIYSVLDGINNYHKGLGTIEKSQTVVAFKWLRMVLLLVIAAKFVFEIYFCREHKSQGNKGEFKSIILMFVFIAIQQLLHQWAYLIYAVKDILKNHANSNVSSIVGYVTYTLYFQILSFLCNKIIKHISWNKNHIPYELTFIFTIFRDTFLTMFLGLSVKIKWYTLIGMIFTKLLTKFIEFHHSIQKLLYGQFEIHQLSRGYMYSLLSTCCVYIGQITFLIVDYGTDGIWMVHAKETKYNLFMSILILASTFCIELITFGVVCYVSNKSKVNIYSMREMKCVHIPWIYFCCVVVYAQIQSIRITKN